MHRIWVAVILFCGLVAMNLSIVAEQGFSLSRDLSQCLVSASASPGWVVPALLLAIFAWVYPQAPIRVVTAKPASLFRQCAALMIDASVGMLMWLPIATLAILAVEAAYTGNFAWTFRRDFLRASDSLYLGVLLIGFLAMFCYFYWHISRGKRTVGEHVLGFVTLPAIQGHAAWKPSWRIWLGIFLFPFAVLEAVQRSEKTLWWNRVSGRTALVTA